MQKGVNCPQLLICSVWQKSFDYQDSALSKKDKQDYAICKQEKPRLQKA